MKGCACEYAGPPTRFGIAEARGTGAFAEFERSMVRERVKFGLKRVVANGQKLRRRPVSKAIELKVRAQLVKGTGVKLASASGRYSASKYPQHGRHSRMA